MRRLIPHGCCIILIMLWQRANLVKPFTKRFVRCCVSSKVDDKSVKKKLVPLPAGVKHNLRDASTDVYLVCDTNLVIDYDHACNYGEGKILG